MSLPEVRTRRATPSDAEAMAIAHRDSIRSLGPVYYPPEVVAAWQDPVDASLYVHAMAAGEVFFIATGEVDGEDVVLGFASDYPIDGGRHGTSVYVRGIVARRGIGSTLLAQAESHALERGASCVEVEASLAGVDFYKANGFVEDGRGETTLITGQPIACVFMRKDLVYR